MNLKKRVIWELIAFPRANQIARIYSVFKMDIKNSKAFPNELKNGIVLTIFTVDTCS